VGGCRRSGQGRGAGDGPPGGAARRSGLAIDGGGAAVAARAKGGGERAVGGEGALGVPRALEAPHAPLAFPRGLVGILGPVVPPFMLAVFDAREHFPLRGTIAGELVGDEHARDILQPLEQFAQELLTVLSG